MKWAFSTAGLVVMGLVGIVIVILFQSITVNNEHDYYLLKETAEAAMFDAVDIPYYRDTGEVKIVQEKFVENFMRRLAEAANKINITDYSVEFYDIMEKPPKASILIKTGLGRYKIYGNVNDYNISNQLDAILEADDTKLNNDYYYGCKTKVVRYYYQSDKNDILLDFGAIKRLYNKNKSQADQLDENYIVKDINKDLKYVRSFMTNSDMKNAGIPDSTYKTTEFGIFEPDINPFQKDRNSTVSAFLKGNWKCETKSCNIYGLVIDVKFTTKSCYEKEEKNG